MRIIWPRNGGPGDATDPRPCRRAVPRCRCRRRAAAAATTAFYAARVHVHRIELPPASLSTLYDEHVRCSVTMSWQLLAFAVSTMRLHVQIKVATVHVSGGAVTTAVNAAASALHSDAPRCGNRALAAPRLTRHPRRPRLRPPRPQHPPRQQRPAVPRARASICQTAPRRWGSPRRCRWQ